MNDYIYGYRHPDGVTYIHTHYTEKIVRRQDNPVRVLVSAIEPLPAPKPVLPTTPGSVVRVDFTESLFVLGNLGWYAIGSPRVETEIVKWNWTLVFDAGAHGEGKTS